MKSPKFFQIGPWTNSFTRRKERHGAQNRQLNSFLFQYCHQKLCHWYTVNIFEMIWCKIRERGFAKLKIDTFSVLVIEKCIKRNFKAATFQWLDEQIHMSDFIKMQVVLVDKDIIYFGDCRSIINSLHLVNLGVHLPWGPLVDWNVLDLKT